MLCQPLDQYDKKPDGLPFFNAELENRAIVRGVKEEITLNFL